MPDENKPNSPFDISKPQTPPLETSSQPYQPRPDPIPQNEPNKSEENKKIPLSDMIKRGTNQYSAIGKTQQYRPPPPPKEATPDLPTQARSPQRVPIPIQEKFLTPMKFTILVVLLIFMGLITAGATLVATEYTLWNPPDGVKNILETILSGGRK